MLTVLSLRLFRSHHCGTQLINIFYCLIDSSAQQKAQSQDWQISMLVVCSKRLRRIGFITRIVEFVPFAGDSEIGLYMTVQKVNCDGIKVVQVQLGHCKWTLGRWTLMPINSIKCSWHDIYCSEGLDSVGGGRHSKTNMGPGGASWPCVPTQYAARASCSVDAIPENVLFVKFLILPPIIFGHKMVIRHMSAFQTTSDIGVCRCRGQQPQIFLIADIVSSSTPSAYVHFRTILKIRTPWRALLPDFSIMQESDLRGCWRQQISWTASEPHWTKDPWSQDDNSAHILVSSSRCDLKTADGPPRSQ